MKKFSLMAALATLVTVSGVYAAWSYAQGDAPAASDTAGLRLETVTTTSKKGTIAITGSINIIIDDMGNYAAGPKGSGEFTISFAPNTGASVEAIPLAYTVTIAGANAWDLGDGQTGNYFAVTQTAPISLGSVGGATTATITADDVLGQLDFTEVTLDTYEDYTKYNSTIGTCVITITVSELK